MMKFNELVQASIISYVASKNLDSCNEDILGCTDSDACNYDIEANIEDNTCIYPDNGFDCYGNCINDSICNNDNLFSLEQERVLVNIHPNPATNYLEVKLNKNSLQPASLKLFNMVGQLDLLKNELNNLSRIDVSHLPSGNYNIQIVYEDIYLKRNIIIQ